jgi:UDP-N-acetylmuramoyl-L-alanyl-D-glutamate--2,6-diaminopimelate ligase
MSVTSVRRLDALARGAGDHVVELRGERSTKVSGLAYDARVATAGDLFFCVPGARADGHDFAPQAVAAGAAALCVERPLALGVPQIVVDDVRRAMPAVAACYWGYPADELVLLGVTGTNGKTTTVYLLESILAADGRTTGLVGTIETRIAGERFPGVRTTPESVDLQATLRAMRDAGVDAAAMEVTSHGVALGRVEGIRFAVVTFTNLSQDHLDFHLSMEDYFEAKRSLFVPERADKGVVNLDDDYGRRLKAVAGIACLTYGMSDDAHVRARDIESSARGSNFVVVTPKGEIRVTTSLVGDFNVSNCLAATATALQAGIDVDAIERGVGSLTSVPGRFEPVDAGQPFTVVVDYAHTPDSLQSSLATARSLGNRVICVFGCGGDRDRGKRPLMGAVAAKMADYIVVTSDNPRGEDPDAIIGEILAGMTPVRADGPDAVIVDRTEAIAHALGVARSGDIVVIAGKGHETGQEFADVTVPFDDRDVTGKTLEDLGWASLRRSGDR